MEVVAAVGADGEFAVARLALVQGRGDGDLDILARLALGSGDENQPAVLVISQGASTFMVNVCGVSAE